MRCFFLCTPSASQCGRCSYALGSSELRIASSGAAPAKQAPAGPTSNPAGPPPSADARPADDGGASSAVGAAAAAEPTDLEARIELLEADLLKVRRLMVWE